MITAAVSASIVALLSFLGVQLSVTQITGIVVVVKIAVVLTVFSVGLFVARRRKRAAAVPVPPPESRPGS